MDSFMRLICPGGRFLGLDWNFWMLVGWLGNLLFTSRFFVQWWATEKHKRVVVPDAFWWLSLSGSGCLLAYGVHRRDWVFIFAYLFTWIPYIRNLIIGHRASRSQVTCGSCRLESPSSANFCQGCGARLGDCVPGARA